MTHASEPQGTHFFHISLSIQTDQGVGFLFSQGTKTPRAGATRQDVFEEILQEVRDSDPQRVGDRSIIVLAFDLQPNQV